MSVEAPDRQSRAFRVPDHPRAVGPLVPLVQLYPLFHGVGGRPVALVWVGDNPAPTNQPDECILNEIFVLVEFVEDLWAKEEVATVLPMTEIAHGRYADDQTVIADVHGVVRRLRWDGQEARHGVARSKALDHVGQRSIREDVCVIRHEHGFVIEVAANPAQAALQLANSIPCQRT